jgi:prevent-host-death family protein
MKTIDLSAGVIPLSEFRANVTKCVEKVRETHRPIMLTQHGRSVSILMNVDEYSMMVDTIDLLKDVQIAERQLENGEGIPHNIAKKRLIQSIRK